MKKTHFSLLVALVILIIPTGMILAQSNQPTGFNAEATPLPLPPDAQPTPIPDVTEYQGTASFTFADLGEEDTVLRYPSQLDLYANFPNEWNLVPGSGTIQEYPTGATNTLTSSPLAGTTFLEIHYDFSDTAGEESTTELSSNTYGNPFFWGERPTIEIYANNILAGSFVPEVGQDLRVQIPVPSSIYFQTAENPYNEFDFHIAYYGDGDIFCNYDGVLSIHSDSSINTAYNWITPYRYPSNLPRPLVQDSFVPEVLKVVVSDNPTPGELKAVANMAAGLSRNSFGNVSYEVLPASQANSATLADSNAVIIGSPENNSFLAQLYAGNLLPSTLGSDGESITAYGGDVDTDTGVLQIIPSNVNSLRTFVTLTGESDLAIFRASDAFASPPIGANYQLLLVDSDYAKPVSMTTINEETGAEAYRSLYKISDLGFNQRTAQGTGTQRFFVSFYVGRDWILEDDITFKINYAHADTINFNSSNAVVLMNGEPIGNLTMGEDPKEVMTEEISIMKEQVVKGAVNVIQINATLNITNICEEYDPAVYWFTVFDDSELTIPYSLTSSELSISPILHPTMPFAYETSHLIVVSENPRPNEIAAIANFYDQLGSLNTNGYYDVTVVMGDDVDLTQYPDHNILMIGLPTDSNFIDMINDDLPQSFISGTNNLEQKIGQADYQLIPGLEVGVIESIKSPNNPGRMITLLTGTSEQGFVWTMDELTADLAGLIGDLFFIEENQTTAFTSSLFSQAVLDSMVSEALDQEEFVPVEEDTADDADTEDTTVVSGEQYMRPEDVNDTTTPFLIIAGIAAVGVILIIYLGTRIASGKRTKK